MNQPQKGVARGKLHRTAERVILILCVSLALSYNNTSYALTVSVNDLTGGTQPTALAAFTQAAGIWESLFVDPVAVTIDFNFTNLGPGILGSTSITSINSTFSNVKTALALDATSPADAIAVANLPGGTAMQFRTNNSSGAVVLDADVSGINNTILDIPRANARALGLAAASGGTTDATIRFSTQFSFDFNPLDGINPTDIDFVGIAAHEIGHALGFVSGVDTVDINSGVNLNNSSVFSVWDLYRYSNDSLALGGAGTLDFATGPHPNGLPYFSIDGGATPLGAFETGSVNGTGRQASHWRDGLGLGIMDPTAADGELLTVTGLDILAFDVMGWDLAATAVPEPSTLLLLIIGILSLAAYRRKSLR